VSNNSRAEGRGHMVLMAMQICLLERGQSGRGLGLFEDLSSAFRMLTTALTYLHSLDIHWSLNNKDTVASGHNFRGTVAVTYTGP
jgi:hypothetical protein